MIQKVLLSAILTLAPLGLAACTGGTMTRTPDQFKTEASTAVQAKIPDLRACYDTAHKSGDVKGKATIHVSLHTFSDHASRVVFAPGELADPKEHGDTTVEKTEGSSKPLNACVQKVLSEVGLSPIDKQVGKGSWTFVFDPDVPDPTATASKLERAATVTRLRCCTRHGQHSTRPQSPETLVSPGQRLGQDRGPLACP